MKMVLNDIKEIRNKIVELFKPTQVTTAVHQKNAILLKRFYENSNGELFTTAIKKILIGLLKSNTDTIFVERLTDFFAHFCSIIKSDQPDHIEHPFVFEIISHLLELSELNSDILRFRSCQLINKILNQLVGSDVSDTLCDKLEKSLLIRIQDPKNTIRQQAVLALHRLQDPKNPDDVIISELITLMNSDSFAKVRLLCVENVAIRPDVFNHIITRIRDVDLQVRLSAYKRLSSFVEFLKISQRRHILHCGFLDTSEKVVDFMKTTLVPKWLEHYQDNVLDLMKSVRFDADEKDIKETLILYQYILKIVFKDKPLTELTQILNLDDTKLIPMESLNWETSCYWRAYVQFLSEQDEFEEELNKVVPELVFFSKYVKEYSSKAQKGTETVDFLEKQFILKQLFLIIQTYDFGDVVNRQCFNSLVSDVLEKVDLMSDVIEVIVKSLENSIPDVNSRSQFVSEIISEIMFPMNSEESQKNDQEKQYELSRVKGRIMCLEDDKEKAVEEQNYAEAERLKEQISKLNEEYKALTESQNVPHEVQKRTDVATIIKYLDVAAGLLLSPQIVQLNPTLRALKDNVIQELLIHNNDNVRAKALRCYALCCIVDKECALIGIHIFSTPIFAYQGGEECDTQTLTVCIGTVIDLLRIYGPQLMAAPQDNALSESTDEAHERVFAGGTSLTDLIQGLVDLMDDEQYEIQEKAVWGLCQLILSDRIRSPSLIARLVVKWCNPASESESEAQKLTQIIGFTLEKVPQTASVDQLEQAVLTTVRILANAPKISPLADVNIDNIANFMISLCKTSPLHVEIQKNLSLKICCEIKDNPKTKFNVTLSKMLLVLDVPNDKVVVKELLQLCDQIRDDVKERVVLNNITKFVASLDKKNLNPAPEVSEESVEKSLGSISQAV